MRYLDEENGFIQYKHDTKNINSLPSNKITSLIQDMDGNYWFTSYGNGLSKLDKQGKFTHFNTKTELSIPNKHLISIHLGDKNTLWIGTDDGVFSFNTQTFKTELFNTKKGLIANTKVDPLVETII